MNPRWSRAGVGVLLLVAVHVVGAQLPAGGPGVDAAQLVPSDKRSGSAFQSAQTRAMQSDPMGNPGLLWVSQGEALWHTAPDGARSCSGCHGQAEDSMRGVATRYPAIDAISGKLLNIEARINTCRSRHQQTSALAYESDELLALSAYIGYQSRAMPVDVSIEGAARPWFERGREFYSNRQGQLNLACRHCHQNNWGRHLRGEHLSQGHGNAYPSYRLEWQTMGSLHRRFRACSAGVRATSYDFGSDEYLGLELFLAWRAAGLPVETPAVRR